MSAVEIRESKEGRLTIQAPMWTRLLFAALGIVVLGLYANYLFPMILGPSGETNLVATVIALALFFALVWGAWRYSLTITFDPIVRQVLFITRVFFFTSRVCRVPFG